MANKQNKSNHKNKVNTSNSDTNSTATSTESFEQMALEEKRKLIFERMNRIILQNMNSSIKDNEIKVRSFSKDDIRKFNENPEKHQKQLNELSNYLYIISPQYRRLINHFSLMPTFDTHIKPYAIKGKPNKKTFEQTYNKVSEYIDLMNLKYEIPKIMINGFKEDTFFGYVYETKDTFFIRKLSTKYCTISSIENGLLVFQFDFSFFNGKEEKLTEYGDEFVKKYTIYRNDSKQRWQELDLENAVCFKVNDDELTYSNPPFSGTFESVIEIDEFRKLRMTKERINNYKIIFEKIPLNSKGEDADSFLVSIDQALQFHSMTANAIDDNVGLALTPFEINTVDFKGDTSDVNRVNDSIESFWNGSGVASGVMGSEKANSGSIIQMSIKNDEAISFRFLRQIEKWINYKISKFNTDSFKFKVEFVESTIYNLDDLVTKLKEQACLGLPVITKLCSVLGIHGEEVNNLNFLESDVLGLYDKFRPLSTSYTQSTDNNGRPTTTEVSDSKDGTIENDSNADRIA